MLAFQIVVMTVLFVGALIFALYASEGEARPKQSGHDPIEDAWRIQEISDAARQEMFREAQQHRWGGDE